jgi:hypothetical protein
MKARRIGQATRGKTAANRLRRTDTWLLLDRSWLPAPSTRPVFVDLGYGAEPTTTLESARRLAALDILVVGVEIDRQRVTNAQMWAEPERIEFRQGGFELGHVDGPVHAVRAMNVLRQYHETQYQTSVDLIRSRLAPGGLLLEGTTSPSGSLCAFHVYARGHHRVLVLAAAELVPSQLQTVLPKDLIHRTGPGTPLSRFFASWDRADDDAQRRRLPRLPFAAEELAAQGYPVDRRPAYLRRGFLVVTEHPSNW